MKKRYFRRDWNNQQSIKKLGGDQFKTTKKNQQG